jgi:hypothetical protein
MSYFSYSRVGLKTQLSGSRAAAVSSSVNPSPGNAARPEELELPGVGDDENWLGGGCLGKKDWMEGETDMVGQDEISDLSFRRGIGR